MNTSAKGELAVLKVLERCVDRDVVASRPTTECNRYDLVLDVDSKLWRVQVKYADGKSPSGRSIVRVASYNTKRGHRGYSEAEIDALLVYLPKTDKVYWLPPTMWEGKQHLTLRHEELNEFEW